MKTSFYFVLWILVYPLLGLFHSEFIYENSFFVALAVVIGLSWLIRRTMPDTLLYEKFSVINPILENVYWGNVKEFGKRLTRQTIMETIGSIYLIVATFFIGITIFVFSENDWFALIIFAVITYGAISKSIKLNNARVALKQNPTPEQCMEIADDTYELDYASYYEARQEHSYEEMFPPKPRYYNAFQIFSIVMAAIAVILGLINFVLALVLFFTPYVYAAKALAGVYFLYGILSTFYGVRDFITIIRYFRKKKDEPVATAS